MTRFVKTCYKTFRQLALVSDICGLGETRLKHYEIIIEFLLHFIFNPEFISLPNQYLQTFTSIVRNSQKFSERVVLLFFSAPVPPVIKTERSKINILNAI